MIIDVQEKDYISTNNILIDSNVSFKNSIDGKFIINGNFNEELINKLFLNRIIPKAYYCQEKTLEQYYLELIGKE